MAQIFTFAREWSKWYRVLRHHKGFGQLDSLRATAIGWHAAESRSQNTSASGFTTAKEKQHVEDLDCRRKEAAPAGGRG